MNVRELITLLEHYPQDMRVVVNGYECGYDDLSPDRVSVVHIALNTGRERYEGRHGDARDFTEAARASAKSWGMDPDRDFTTTVDALALQRSSC